MNLRELLLLPDLTLTLTCTLTLTLTLALTHLTSSHVYSRDQASRSIIYVYMYKSVGNVLQLGYACLLWWCMRKLTRVAV